MQGRRLNLPPPVAFRLAPPPPAADTATINRGASLPMYVLHTLPDSAGTAVHLMLLEQRQPFLMTVIDRSADTRDRPEFRALQPMGKVPALETPEGPLFETAAILLWLADRHGGMAPGPADPGRGDFLKWLFFTSTNVHAAMMPLFYPARYTGTEEGNATFLRTTGQRLAEALALLDAAVARHPAWCPPDAPSALGLYLAVQLRWLGQMPPGDPGRVDPAAYPALMAVLRMLEQRPAALDAAHAEGLGATIFSRPAA